MKALLASTAMLAIIASPASAAIFDFSYSGTGIVASGQITTDDAVDADGFSVVTGLTGTRNGLGISLLALNAFLGNDNLFRSTSPFFTNNGLSFTDGVQSYNLFFTAGGCPGFVTESTGSTTCAVLPRVDFQASAAGPVNGAVPEPATWAMMIAGFGAVGFAMRRRKITARIQFA